RSNRLQHVAPGSAAARAGLRKGDSLQELNAFRTASFADVQYALHRAPARGRIAVSWDRAGKVHHGKLSLDAGWRKTDVSWRWSRRGPAPVPPVHGDDLEPEEKKALGLNARRLAFRQGAFVLQAAAQAGIRQNDVIIGLDNKALEMTARQFGAYLR